MVCNHTSAIKHNISAGQSTINLKNDTKVFLVPSMELINRNRGIFRTIYISYFYLFLFLHVNHKQCKCTTIYFHFLAFRYQKIKKDP